MTTTMLVCVVAAAVVVIAVGGLSFWAIGHEDRAIMAKAREEPVSIRSWLMTGMLALIVAMLAGLCIAPVPGPVSLPSQKVVYQMDTKPVAAQRNDRTIRNWSLSDAYDSSQSRYTGEWAVYATQDVVDYSSGQAVTLARKGERIAGTGVDGSRFGGDLFTTSDRDGVVTVEATARYLAVASSNDRSEQSWRAYMRFDQFLQSGRSGNRYLKPVLAGLVAGLLIVLYLSWDSRAAQQLSGWRPRPRRGRGQ